MQRTNSDSPRRAFVLSDEAVSAVWASRMGGFVAFRNALDDGMAKGLAALISPAGGDSE